MRRLGAFAIAALAAVPALAQEGITVDTLLFEGYEIKAAFPTSVGPGLVLQKDDRVVMCFVAETPESAEIATQYCKPVH